MEDRTDSPMAVKVEEHSRCVILTYFHGDTNSMVDAHFNRALSTVCKTKAPAVKTKKTRKTVKLEETSPCKGSAVDSFSESQVPPVAGRLLPFSPPDDAPGSWHSFTSRAGEGPGLQPITYSLSPEGLSLTGQQYATSLLNLLHNDRGEMVPSMASTSKPELLPSWTMPQGFRESVDPAVGYESGRRLDKKDLYWYWKERATSPANTASTTPHSCGFEKPPCFLYNPVDVRCFPVKQASECDLTTHRRNSSSSFPLPAHSISQWNDFSNHSMYQLEQSFSKGTLWQTCSSTLVTPLVDLRALYMLLLPLWLRWMKGIFLCPFQPLLLVGLCQ